MTTTMPGPTPSPRPPYELAHEPDGTSVTARANLVDILRRELLGPHDGDEEVLDVSPVARYLVGRIAPTRLNRTDPGTDDPDAIDVDDLDAGVSTGVPVVGEDEAGSGIDEDASDGKDDDPQRRGLMIPASMGLRFQVPAGIDSVTVHASWATYHPERPTQAERERAEAEGRIAHTRYRRTPAELPIRIRLADLVPGRTRDYVLRGHVILRADAYQDADRLLVEIALCNDRVAPRRIPVEDWLFQTSLAVDADGAGAFLPVRDVTTAPELLADQDIEDQRLALQYRDRLEFAVGRTCSATWSRAPGTRRATSVRTDWLPLVETPPVTARSLEGAELDMTHLATATPAQLETGLRPIATAYTAWLDEQERHRARLPEHLAKVAEEPVEEARQVADQLADGIDLLVADTRSGAEARRCFAFMNRVMADQRIHSQIADIRHRHPEIPVADARAEALAGRFPHHWRVFQLAFILMQIRALTEPTLERRSGGPSGDMSTLELLFFPTGGGKTEAYLGLAAYAMAARRLQGRVDTPDGPLDGAAGVTVLMRYTLRLLTSQQFQRATTLICAAELARREDPTTWGDEPFRIGLWVGTAVSPKRVEEAATEIARVNEQGGAGYRLTVLQLGRCPWCGRTIDPSCVKSDTRAGRIYVRCSDPLAACPFSEGGRVGDGIPVLTTDEEIYRLVPAFVIATVDKLARLAREGQAASLFGYVGRRCERHGYLPHPAHDRTIDAFGCTTITGHRKEAGMPAAAIRPTTRLRPPDLVIQDELHLITGALGTTIGLFEVAVDAMTTWRMTDHDGRILPVRPLLVGSSATVRNARDQVRGLYGRHITVFPPQVLDASDTFFSHEQAPAPDDPGRLYLGLAPTGVRMTNAEIQVAQVLLAAGQLLLDRDEAPAPDRLPAADPYMTLVGYYSATRELAGMARYVQDDIQTAVTKGLPASRLPRRRGTTFGTLTLGELTSRIASADITRTLEDMALPFDVEHDTTAARARAGWARRAGKQLPSRDRSPYDIILATSMLQVGVDVSRLGLMLVVGQPKNTAEYIQASSRVGRDPSRPGLVVTLCNWVRPRDLAHFEQFRHYHETFYARVEPLSVTPLSSTSLERGLPGALVAATRVTQGGVPNGLNPERNAWMIDEQEAALDRLVATMTERAAQAGDEESAKDARIRLLGELRTWQQLARRVRQDREFLAYEKTPSSAGSPPYQALIRSAESSGRRSADGAPFVVANSMREVQPEINLLVSPDPARLAWTEPDDAPRWEAQSPKEDQR